VRSERRIDGLALESPKQGRRASADSELRVDAARRVVRRESVLRRALLYQLGPSSAPDFETLVEEVSLAEELGIEGVWCLPSLNDEGNFESSAPELWLSALASRTRRLRLGWGIASMLPPERAPIRVAEQAASLDLACEGRLDLVFLPEGELDAEGSGGSFAGGPGRDRPWDEGVRMLVEMWARPAFSWTSPRFEVGPVDVLPKPAQRPHPALWLAGWHAGHATRAGAGGLGFLDVSGASDEGLAAHSNAYLEGRAQANVQDLVCESTFAAALDCRAEDLEARLGAWERMGIDRAIVRVGPLEGGHSEALERIRRVAGEDARVH
jgi:alkanesulfonate monooxygenase SsuD/methylene tetrahydromethanopterin reductase-like flavin-dependent oxidoreductase (luciferase family)